MIQARSGNRRQGEILMIVGAAGIVTGLLVNEDLVTVAGAGVGGALILGLRPRPRGRTARPNLEELTMPSVMNQARPAARAAAFARGSRTKCASACSSA